MPQSPDISEVHTRIVRDHQGRNRREMALITKAFGDVDDDDHRVAAVNLQARGLNDTWASLLSSTLWANRTVRAINLNKCEAD